MLSSVAPVFEGSMAFFVFLEGLMAFVSPCILPMLPVYLMYLSGEDGSSRGRLVNALCFVLGFTLLFTLLGAGATSLGQLLSQHRALLSRISGVIMILFGLHYTGVLRLGFLNREYRLHASPKALTPIKSLVFGMAFSFGWTPCLGPLLGSALMMAGNAATVWQGMLMLFLFAMGLGVPFVLCALIYGKLAGTLGWFKRHQVLVQRISGCVLMAAGLLLAFDLFGYYSALFS